MGLWELFVIAVGLSMDAFAVSICKGLATGKVTSAARPDCRASILAGFRL